MPILNERIAVLEQKAIDNERQNAAILEKLESIQSDLSAANNELSKYKGVMGFITFLITCVGVFFTALPMFRK